VRQNGFLKGRPKIHQPDVPTDQLTCTRSFFSAQAQCLQNFLLLWNSSVYNYHLINNHWPDLPLGRFNRS